jgi:hypothetical protein
MGSLTVATISQVEEPESPRKTAANAFALLCLLIHATLLDSYSSSLRPIQRNAESRPCRVNIPTVSWQFMSCGPMALTSTASLLRLRHVWQSETIAYPGRTESPTSAQSDAIAGPAAKKLHVSVSDGLRRAHAASPLTCAAAMKPFFRNIARWTWVGCLSSQKM